MTNDGDGSGYVHDPDRPDAEADDRDPPTDPRTTRAYVEGASSAESFGRRGWALVGALFVAFVLVPGIILYLPYAGGAIRSLGLTYRDAYLVLPLVPALVLAALAVWTAVGNR
ncbi:hypothetical protein BRC94_07255 [Halobacteriales archaeon QS_5_70_17]|nr:MAG: hypothetical protein BRC94_07255 [Halobacteriales archaeon QS_5_70_17]